MVHLSICMTAPGSPIVRHRALLRDIGIDDDEVVPAVLRVARVVSCLESLKQQLEAELLDIEERLVAVKSGSLAPIPIG